jgi:hypothetical protein
MGPVFEIPHPRALTRHALPHIVEATLVPLAVFYLAVMWALGMWGALVAPWPGLTGRCCGAR